MNYYWEVKKKIIIGFIILSVSKILSTKLAPLIPDWYQEFMLPIKFNPVNHENHYQLRYELMEEMAKF